MNWIEQKASKMHKNLQERDLRYKLLIKILKKDIPEDIKDKLDILCRSNVYSDLVLVQEILKTL